MKSAPVALIVLAFAAVLQADDLGQWEAPERVKVEQVPAYTSQIWRVDGVDPEKPPYMAVIAAPGQWGDQVLEVGCRPGEAGWVGLRFRNRYDLFFNGRGNLVLRCDYKVLVSKRLNLARDAFHRLRLIAVGPVLIAEVDGVRQITYEHDGQLEGRSGVLVHAAPAEIAEVSITDAPPAADMAQLTVAQPAEALLFAPQTPINMTLRFDTLAAAAGRGNVRAVVTPALRDDPGLLHLDGFGDLPPHASVIHENGDAILRFGGDSVMAMSQVGYRYAYHQDLWRTFYMKVDVRRAATGSAGVVFGCDGNVTYEVQFTGDNRLVLRRIDPGWKPVVLGVTPPQFEPEPFHTLEIFRDGANYALLVDGQAQLVGQDDASVTGAVGLLLIRTRADFRNLSISNVVPQHDAVPFAAAPPRRAVTYVGDFAAALTGLQSKPWAAAAATVDLAAVREASLDFAPLPAGLYDMVVDVAFDDGSTKSRVMPLLVADVPQQAPRDPQRFELLGYGKYSYDDPIADNTYLHAVCLRLRGCGLTGIAHPFKSEAQLDIVQRHGMSAVLRDSMPQWAHHPAVLTMLVGDEPSTENIAGYKQRYDELRKDAPDLAMMTCMIGESSGTAKPQDPAAVWDALEPAHRLLRLYPIRKAAYGVLDPAPGHPPLLDVLTRARDYGPTDWWFVAQSFGGSVQPQRAAPYWRNPSGAELRTMMSLAAAAGAKGLYFYTFQSEGDFECLVHRRTLRDVDDKAAALRDTAGQLQYMHRTLRGTTPASFDVACEPASVYVARYEGGGRRFVRLVNMDARRGVVANLTTAGQTLTVPLEPGGASLHTFAVSE